MGHEDHLVAHIPQAPVVKAGVPGVGLDAHIQGLAVGQSGPQLLHEGDIILFYGIPLQPLKVDGQAGVVSGGGHQGVNGLGPGVGVVDHSGHGGGGGAVGQGHRVGGRAKDTQVVVHPMAGEVVGGGGGIGGFHPVVAVCAGGVEGGAIFAVLQPGPAHADGVHIGGQVDL